MGARFPGHSNTATDNDASRNPLVRNAWMFAGGLAIAGAGLAAALAYRPAPAEGAAPGSMQATRTSLASNEAVVNPDAKVATPAPIPAKPAQFSVAHRHPRLFMVSCVPAARTSQSKARSLLSSLEIFRFARPEEASGRSRWRRSSARAR